MPDSVSSPIGSVEPRLGEQTYNELRSAIVHGRLRPNQRLIETELAEEYAVSRTPVRETLQRLAVEGLIVPARRGWIVREHSVEEISEIYEVRAALEGFAARLAAQRGTKAQLDEVAAIVRERSFAPPPQTAREQLVAGNDRFHDSIINAAGNERLREQIRQTCEYYFNFQLANLYTPDEIARSADQHARIARALRKRDADQAETVMREHVSEALSVIRDRLR